MTAAVIWLVVWLVVGIVGTWIGIFSIFVSFGSSLFEWIDDRKSRMNWGIFFLILFGTIGWTILWVINVVLQIVSIFQATS